jgi:S1-C subfamily serine protease
MMKFFGLLFAGILSTFATLAQAQSTWVQIEAKRTLDEAESAARIYAQDFPFVSAFALQSGWYAIVLGPFTEAQAQERLYALLAAGQIPQDSFLAETSRFTRKVWPDGESVATDPAVEPVVDPALEPVVEPTVEPTTEVAEPDLARLPDETPREARASEAALDPEQRKLIQTALAWEGFYTSVIDGDYGPGTRKSMAAWQVARGYEETGILTSRQRAELINDYQAVVSSLDMRATLDNSAGIEVEMPLGLVERGDIVPPFANYPEKDGSGVQVILISQSGDKSTLYGLYDILQTLEILPVEGERAKEDASFFINGANAQVLAHAEAQLTDDGAIKGFILVWPAKDERRYRFALREMQASFRAVAGSTLPDVMTEGGVQDPDLLSGLEIRRPDLTRSGFYVDAGGLILTSSDVLQGCSRLTLDDRIPLSVVAEDKALGLAVLKAETTLAPLRFASFRSGDPRLQSEVAVSGYAYDGRLGAPVLTFGRLQDVKGLNGESDIDRLDLKATPSDAGGPVFDTTGAVFGVLLPAQGSDGQVLPANAAFVRDFGAVNAFLTKSGVTPVLTDSTADMPAETLARMAADMTVRVACWK